MRSDSRRDMDRDIADAWQGQALENVRFSLEDIRRRAGRMQKSVTWRNLREMVVGSAAIAVFGYYFSVFPSIVIRAGCALTIAGTLFVIYTLLRRGAARGAPAEAGFSTCVDFHRRELERQRDLLQKVWSWYLLPFAPGLLVFLTGLFLLAMQQPTATAHAAVIIVTFVLAILGCGALFLLIAMLNRGAARRLQRAIDALERADEE